MKISICVLLVIFLVVLGMWLTDIANDKEKRVKITTSVSAYNDWECSYENKPNCNIVFKIVAGSEYDVKRIRYGKDFMAIEIKQKDLNGWVFSGEGVQIIAKPSI